MILRIFGHGFHYECENLCRVFFPNEKIKIAYDSEGSDPLEVITRLEGENAFVQANINGVSRSASGTFSPDEAELGTAKLIYSVLGEITGYTPPWGVLTGVRPSKLMMKLTDTLGSGGAQAYFTRDLLVSEEKAQLARAVAQAERGIIASAPPNSVSLYVSIPFCPSRCSYCSFVSHSVTSPSARKLLPEYVDMLAKEIASAGETVRRLGLELDSVYFGGGTPGTLQASQLDRLQCEIEKSFDLSRLKEYTVEIGRPDTVTPDKLSVLRLHNTGRISINPQTFNAGTLELIGREHSPAQALDAYRLARGYGFDCINMDLIAGLPGEKCADFVSSLDTAISLAPENITVHTLALKRSSTLGTGGSSVADGREAGQMLDYAKHALTAGGYSPYYMYRQSKCVGNLENVGWCKKGKESFYNVIMMEETHTVIGTGAGAVTKLCDPCTGYVERIFNYKYPYEYITGFDTLEERKKGIEEFYLNKYSPGKDDDNLGAE